MPVRSDASAVAADELLAAAAVGQLATSMADGTLGDIDQETMLEMAGSLEDAPHMAASFVLGQDLSGQNDGSLDGAAIGRAVMDEYYGAWLTRLQEGFDQETDRREIRRKAAHRSSVYAYSRMTPDDVARAEWDAENGDDSLLLQAEERFYLG